MKEVNLSEMTNIVGGGIDCTYEDTLAFIAGAGLAGALFFGWGGLVTGYVALGYVRSICPYL